MRQKRNLVLVAFLLSAFFAQAQIKITGEVYSSEDNLPVIGVSIVDKNTRKGTVTDGDGKFEISVPGKSSVLTFSYIGMIPREIPVGNQRTLTVTLEPDVKMIDEVVVTGYGTSARSDFTGSVTSILSDELMKSNTISFMEAMQGRMSGVQIVSNSGEPGAGIAINIRGGNSVNAGSQPLYVIDGMQIDINPDEVSGNPYGADVQYNPLAGLNPSDIKSIDILKDASATAIYGSRAANGVVMITTKSGGGQRTTVDLDAYWGASSTINTIKVLSGADFLKYRYLRDPKSLRWGNDLDGDKLADEIKDVSEFETHNWQDEILRNGLIQSYNLSVATGGKSNTRLATSLGYLDHDGVVKNNNFKRYSLRLRGDVTVNKKLTIGTSLNLTHSITTGGTATAGGEAAGTNAGGMIQGFIIYTPLITGNQDDEDPELNGGISRPDAFIDSAFKNLPATRIMGNAYAKYKITDALTLDISGGSTLTASKSQEWYSASTSWGKEPKNGLAIYSETSSTSWQNSNTLTYTKYFNRRNYLNAMAGFEMSAYTLDKFWTVATNFENQSINGVFDINQGSILPNKVQSLKTENRRMSQFGRVNYVYLNKYMFTGTLRRDGSSKFGANNKYALFPSGAFAWKAHEERFLKPIKAIDELKFRTSIGLTGNDRIPEYQSLSRTDKTYYSNGQGGVELGLSPSELPNPNLKWESTTQVDAGIDLQLFKKRIGLTFDWYKKMTTDMLLHTEIPSQTGSKYQWQNIGQVNNTGIEITLATTNIETKDFVWTSNINFNINRNKVISLGNTPYLQATVKGGHISEAGRVLVGHPLGTGWGYVFDGIYQEADFDENGNLREGIPAYRGVKVNPGDMKFKNIGGESDIDPENDKTIISNSEPKHYGGFSNTFQYKGFELSAFFNWSYGNDILNIGRYRYEGSNIAYNISYEYFRNAWTPENPGNKYPAFASNSQFRTQNSSYYVEDGSYLRLKNLVFAYHFLPRVYHKLGMQSLRVYISADNLYTWTNYSGYDPEVSYHNKLISGLDYTSYPRSRTIVFGINAKF
jgi:TonB-linked SusC/RagA family outer membrane protein